MKVRVSETGDLMVEVKKTNQGVWAYDESYCKKISPGKGKVVVKWVFADSGFMRSTDTGSLDMNEFCRHL